jgi:FkbM family methyltransferase
MGTSSWSPLWSRSIFYCRGPDPVHKNKKDMINNFISKLPFFDKLVFLTGKLFIKIGSWIFSYKNYGFWQPHYNKLETNKVAVDFDGNYLHYDINGLKASARKTASDSLVFEQVILQEEYKTAMDIFLLNNIPFKTFIDLGSNIGLATIYIKKIFPDARVIALEPDKNNYAELLKNFRDNGLTNATPLMAGVGKKDCYLVTDERLRDSQDWSISFKEVDFETPIVSYSINSLLEKYGLANVDFIKIDIEGGEKAIFDQDADISFLDKVKVIAVEIHDEFNIRDHIYEVLKAKDFILFNSTETTIAVKRNLFQN